MALRALIFDVDGTLAETEEIHRAAFERAFTEAGLSWRWTVDRYRELLAVTGGKERIRHFIATTPGVEDPGDDRIAALHARKNEIYGEIVRGGGCALRPGVAALVRAAQAAGLRLAIATTTSRSNVDALLAAAFADARADLFDPIVCGEDVAAKKPSPEAYHVALARLGLPAADCLAFEDSKNGLTAARGAGLATILTPSLYTAHERFDGASAILADLAAFDLEAHRRARA